MNRMLTMIAALTLSLLLASPALALNLDEAKSQGLVGEKINGYIGAVQPSGNVNALVKNINAKRKSHYQQISYKNGTSLGNVEKLAGEKLINRAPRGQYVNRGSGWVRK